MELGRPSNLGSLISAVLVGLLALGANEYARLDPRKLDVFFSSISSKPEPATTMAPPPPPKPTVASLTRAINSSERDLFPLFDKVKARAVAVDDESLRPALKQLSNTLADLESDETMCARLSPPTQLALLRALFMAAELQAEPFTDVFNAHSQQLLMSSNRQLASQAAALSFFRAHDLSHPQPQVIVTGLRKFSAEHPDAELGILFYLNVADQLLSQGHSELARTVIKLGIEVYKDRGGTHRLVNWLIDHNPPGSRR